MSVSRNNLEKLYNYIKDLDCSQYYTDFDIIYTGMDQFGFVKKQECVCSMFEYVPRSFQIDGLEFTDSDNKKQVLSKINSLRNGE